MYRGTFYTFLIATYFLTFIMCNGEQGTVQTGPKYGSISGKILHPDSNLSIRIEAKNGTHTTPCDPATHQFTADSIPYGNCLIKVTADDYLLFEKKVALDRPQYICPDITLSQRPWQIAYLDPASSQYIDSQFCSLHEPSITDTGFLICLTFSNVMDTASVEDALTILPDTAGVQLLWARNSSLYIYFPYWKLSTVDTVKVSVSKTAKNADYLGNDTLENDFSFFYPIDTSYIRTSRLSKHK